MVLFSLTQKVLKNMDFCPLCIGIFETGLELFLNTCSSVTGNAFSSPALILQDRDTKSEVSTSFLKVSASSSFITHFTYKCNLSNQFCFQDSHLFPSLCPHFYKMLMWAETAFPKMHISALGSSVTDVHILWANLVALSQTVSKGKKTKYQHSDLVWPSSDLL